MSLPTTPFIAVYQSAAGFRERGGAYQTSDQFIKDWLYDENSHTLSVETILEWRLDEEDADYMAEELAAIEAGKIVMAIGDNGGYEIYDSEDEAAQAAFFDDGNGYIIESAAEYRELTEERGAQWAMNWSSSFTKIAREAAEELGWISDEVLA